MKNSKEHTYPTVEAVEGGVEVEAEAKTVHLQKHLSQEQSQKHELCIVCKRFENIYSAMIRYV